MRTYGTGSIIADTTKKRYVARYKDELDVVHKKSFPMTKQGKRQAEEFLKFINKQKEEQISTDVITLGEWLLKYITLYKQPVLRTRSLERVKQSALLWKELYKYPLHDLRPAIIQNQILKFTERGLKPSTIKKTHDLLKASLKQAVAERFLLHNPAAAVPSVRQSKTKIEIFTKKEIGQIFHSLRKIKNARRNTSQRYDMILFFRLLLTTGMRVSELLALRWENIDDEHIHVIETKSGLSTQEFNKPKTAAGERYIPFLSQKTKKMLFSLPRHKFVFENKNGGAMNYQRVFLTWDNVRKMTGITKTIHTFRHTFASYLLTVGNVPLAEASELLGHASPSITLDIYTHHIHEYKIKNTR